MTDDYMRRNQAVIPTSCSTMFSVFEHINTSLAPLSEAVDLASVFIFKPVFRHCQRQLAFRGQGQKHCFTSPPQVYINSLALCKIVLGRELGNLKISR